MAIKLKNGSIYKDCDDTVAPAFSSDQDVETWRGLKGLKFKELIVVLEDVDDLKRDFVKNKKT